MNTTVLTEVKYDNDEQLFKPHHKILINIDEIALVEEVVEHNISKIWLKRLDMWVLVKESFNHIQSMIQGPQHYVPDNLDDDL